jgi:hypothetical protein
MGAQVEKSRDIITNLPQFNKKMDVRFAWRAWPNVKQYRAELNGSELISLQRVAF